MKKDALKSTSELLEMDQAIALLKTTRPTFYRWLRAGKIKGMKVGRQWRFNREDIEHFLKGEQPRIELPVSPEPLIVALEDRLRKIGVKNLPARNGDLITYVTTLIILLAAKSHASDLHIAPQQTPEQPKGFVNFRIRIDGLLHHVVDFDLRLLAPLIERWKIMAGCDPRESRKPQDGRLMVTVEERPVDIRNSFLPSVLGETLTARLLSSRDAILTLDRINYRPRDKECLLRALSSSWGMVLVTGPTGSGKTTVLYSCLTQVNQPNRKIVSIEDPVEYLLPGVVQVAVRQDVGVTFPSALRATLRSDPDVVVVGEIRDRDTLHICFQVALTGHLVLSTMHTSSAVSALRRMVDLGSDPFLVTDATKLILNQRLVRCLCPACSKPALPAAEILATARPLAEAGGIRGDSLPQNYRQPVGCAKCAQTGYRGRTVIAEALEITPEIATALRRGADTQELQAIAVRQGMTTLAADGMAKAAAGITTVEEVLRYCGSR